MFPEQKISEFDESVVKWIQGISPIAISIAILKKIADRDRDRSFAIADLLGDLFTYCKQGIFFLFLTYLYHFLQK